MKKLKIIAVTAMLLVISSCLYAQEKTPPRPLVMETMYVSPSGNDLRINLDSLLKIWKERVKDVNPYYVSTRIIRHWFGHDSREIIFISELKSWNDIDLADAKEQEILKEHKGWTTKEDFQAFGKLWRAVFLQNAHHSDEIYQIVAE